MVSMPTAGLLTEAPNSSTAHSLLAQRSPSRTSLAMADPPSYQPTRLESWLEYLRRTFRFITSSEESATAHSMDLLRSSDCATASRIAFSPGQARAIPAPVFAGAA